MQPQEENAPRSIKLTIVAVALLALLAVVAFASRSGLGHESQAQPTPRYVSYAFTLFLIVFVLAIPVAAYGFLIQAREGQVARKSFKSRILSNFATMLFFGFLAFMVIYMKRHHNQIFHIDTSALDKSKNALKNRPHRTGAGEVRAALRMARLLDRTRGDPRQRGGDVRALPPAEEAQVH